MALIGLLFGYPGDPSTTLTLFYETSITNNQKRVPDEVRHPLLVVGYWWVYCDFEFCQSASLLASILPIAATIRQKRVKPPTMYHQFVLGINPDIQELRSG
jgi:hypothetical protein